MQFKQQSSKQNVRIGTAFINLCTGMSTHKAMDMQCHCRSLGGSAAHRKNRCGFYTAGTACKKMSFIL